MATETSVPTRVVGFRLAGHEYALPLVEVVEIVRMVAIDPIPHAPPFLLGAINLRGRVLPVMDLRVRLGLPARAPGLDARIVVAAVDGQLVGLVVDETNGLLSLSPDSVQPPPELAGPQPAVSGVARAQDGLISILDLARLCADGDALSLPE